MADGSSNIIRVLIVEDSPSICKVLKSILGSDPRISVVGVAYNGREAIELVAKLRPDVVTMDIHMPVMDGLEATKQIMAYYPTPILVISSSVWEGELYKIFDAISYGALDVIEKGQEDLIGNHRCGEELIEKVKLLSGIKVIRHPLAKLEKEDNIGVIKISERKNLDRVVAIVTSTGGPQALLKIFKSFPVNFPCGILVVQHIIPGFMGGLVDWLNRECQIMIKIAEDSEKIRAGVAYIAPCNFHMEVKEDGKIYLTTKLSHNKNNRLLGDVLLESVARVYKKGAIGVILTGMGRDGVIGMKAIRQMQGRTIAQDERSCAVFGMPKAAIDMGVIDRILPLDGIAEEIVKILNKGIVG